MIKERPCERKRPRTGPVPSGGHQPAVPLTCRWLVCLFLTAVVMGSVPLSGATLDLPDSLIIDSLSDLYGGVDFDHIMHVETVDDCTVCHHHTVGVPSSNETCARCHDLENTVQTVACGDCHLADPFSATSIRIKEADPSLYHIDRPGLKAAFHLNCLGCHREWGAPTGCEDCHQRTEAGDRFYRSGLYAPAGDRDAPGH